jgi:hypothetical protein
LNLHSLARHSSIRRPAALILYPKWNYKKIMRCGLDFNIQSIEEGVSEKF